MTSGAETKHACAERVGFIGGMRDPVKIRPKKKPADHPVGRFFIFKSYQRAPLPRLTGHG